MSRFCLYIYIYYNICILCTNYPLSLTVYTQNTGTKVCTKPAPTCTNYAPARSSLYPPKDTSIPRGRSGCAEGYRQKMRKIAKTFPRRICAPRANRSPVRTPHTTSPCGLSSARIYAPSLYGHHAAWLKGFDSTLTAPSAPNS